MSRKEAKRLKRVETPSPTKGGGPKQDDSPQVYQRDKLDWTLSIRERRDLRDKQKAFIDCILDKKTKVVFINGPAGTSKTWLAVYCGLLLLNQKRASHITFVRTIVESASKSLGTLPGEAEDKMSPYLRPLMDKLEELLPAGEVKRLMSESRCEGTPVNYLRGASLPAQYIVVEEAQNYDLKELTTVLTRIGEYSKMVLIGDADQSDLNGRSGWSGLYDWFNQPSMQAQGIHCLAFTKEDIVRSGILRVIVEQLEQYKAAHPVKH